jgi:Fe-S cluster assembly protein SufD
MKSALRESAHLCFRGLIHVEPGAPGTDAYLSNRNLILDDGARAESLPQLRIETDDVACSHGSATGGPREDELFYLMSRGLDRDGALRLLVLGHLGSVLDRAPPELAGELEAIAARSLGGSNGSEQASGASR